MPGMLPLPRRPWTPTYRCRRQRRVDSTHDSVRRQLEGYRSPMSIVIYRLKENARLTVE